MTKYSVILLVFFLSCDSGSKEEPPSGPQLIWADEFDGPEGQSPSSRNWTYDIGTDWGNNQLEYDTDRPENVSLDGNGNLVITAIEEDYNGQPYTSARILTRGLFSVQYGRIEARMKMPTGQGLWPAFWMLGTNFPQVGWPDCGEIDIMEYRGQEPNITHGSLHGPGYSAGNAFTNSYTLPDGGFDTDFHVFAVEWTSSRIQWFVDDVLFATAEPGDAGFNGGQWAFSHPFFLILNLAVGGSFVGAPNDETVFPQTLEVDWVRVYDL